MINQLQIETGTLDRFKKNKGEIAMGTRVNMWINHLAESGHAEFEKGGIPTDSKGSLSNRLIETSYLNLRIQDKDKYRTFKRELSVIGVSLNFAVNAMIKKFNEQGWLFDVKIKV